MFKEIRPMSGPSGVQSMDLVYGSGPLDQVHELVAPWTRSTVSQGGPWTGSTEVVHGLGPQRWSTDLGPCFVYVLNKCFVVMSIPNAWPRFMWYEQDISIAVLITN